MLTSILTSFILIGTAGGLFFLSVSKNILKQETPLGIGKGIQWESYRTLCSPSRMGRGWDDKQFLVKEKSEMAENKVAN